MQRSHVAVTLLCPNNSKFSNHGTTKRNDPHIKRTKIISKHGVLQRMWLVALPYPGGQVASGKACWWDLKPGKTDPQDWYTGGNHHKPLIAGRILPILIPNHPLYLLFNTYIIWVATSLDDVATCFLFHFASYAIEPIKYTPPCTPRMSMNICTYDLHMSIDPL